MTKALVVSLLVLTMVVPIQLAADRKPRRGARRTSLWMAALTVAWGLLCAFVYIRL